MMTQTINELCREAHANSKSKGFWNDLHNVKHGYYGATSDGKPLIDAAFELQFKLARFALIASEVGEAVEAIRRNDNENLAEEIADICIRCFDFCGGFDIDLELAILNKMIKNSERPYMHGKNS